MLRLCLRIRHALGVGSLVAVSLVCQHVAFAQPTTEASALTTSPAASATTPVVPSSEHAELPNQPPASSVVAPELAQGVDPAPLRPNTSRRTKSLPPPEDAREPEMHWYGWQTLVADAASVAAVAAGIGFENAVVGLSGFGGYMFGAPLVHWYRGAIGRGFASFGMRFAAEALFVVGGAGCLASSLSGNDNGTCGVMIVGLLMIPTAMAVDAAVLSWEEEPMHEAGTRVLSPWFSAERRAAGVVWQGTF